MRGTFASDQQRFSAAGRAPSTLNEASAARCSSVAAQEYAPSSRLASRRLDRVHPPTFSEPRALRAISAGSIFLAALDALGGTRALVQSGTRAGCDAEGWVLFAAQSDHQKISNQRRWVVDGRARRPRASRPSASRSGFGRGSARGGCRRCLLFEYGTVAARGEHRMADTIAGARHSDAWCVDALTSETEAATG